MKARERLTLALALVAAIAVLEAWGGIASHSLALLTDAVHVCMDVFALAIALFATLAAARPADRRKTFGYGRIEVLAALFNGALLFAVTLILVFEAIRRFSAPVEPGGALMTIVAAVGLIANGVVGATLAHDHATNLNVRAALFHVAGDALGALAVVVGGVVILLTHAAWIDPLLSIFVAVIITVGVVRIVRDAGDVLLEGAPAGVDADDVERRIAEIPGVAGVHDLHVWTIGSESHALSAHVLLDDRRISEVANVLEGLRELVRRRYGIGHVTVQFECQHCDPRGVFVCRPE